MATLNDTVSESTGDTKLDEYLRGKAVSQTVEVYVPNANEMDNRRCHKSSPFFNLAGMTWAVSVDCAYDSDSDSDSDSDGAAESDSVGIHLHDCGARNFPKQAGPHVHATLALHPASEAIQPLSKEVSMTLDDKHCGCKRWGYPKFASKTQVGQDGWLQADGSLRVTATVTMQLKSAEGLALLRALCGLAPKPWLPCAVFDYSSALREAESACGEGVSVSVLPEQVLQLKFAVTLKRKQFDLTYRAAIDALLGESGLTITHEWRGADEPRTCCQTLLVQPSIYQQSIVLRDIAATGAASSGNATRLQIHPWKLVAVLAVSLQTEWLVRRPKVGGDSAHHNGNAQHVAYLSVLLKAAHFLQHVPAIERIRKALPSCDGLATLQVCQQAALLQAMQDLPLDVSAAKIRDDCSAKLDRILNLPPPFIKMWLLGCHPLVLDLSGRSISASSFAVLLTHLPTATRLRTLGLNLADLKTIEPACTTPCAFSPGMVAGGTPTCKACSARVTSANPMAVRHALDRVAAGDTAVQALSSAAQHLPELTDLAPLRFYASVHNLFWLQHLFAAAPRLTHLHICAVATGSGANKVTPCFAMMFMQSFTMLPQLEELRLTAFPGTLYSCMLEVLRDHPALKRVIVDGALLYGAVPQSMRGIVKRSREAGSPMSCEKGS